MSCARTAAFVLVAISPSLFVVASSCAIVTDGDGIGGNVEDNAMMSSSLDVSASSQSSQASTSQASTTDAQSSTNAASTTDAQSSAAGVGGFGQ